MMVHHICTMALISCYLISNVHFIGAMIAVLHDWADIFATLARMLQPSKYISMSFFFFIIMMIIWVWTRLLVLPYLIYLLYAELNPLQESLPQSEIRIKYIYSFCFFLGSLAFLHYYWFFMLTQMLLNYVFKGKGEDLLQKTENTAKTSKKKTN